MENFINYALVEQTRPPIYTAMKYWGKKPHNIWRAYIECFTPKNGVFLDPFCGSGMSAIEAIKSRRKAICFDLNPLSVFFIDIYTSPFDFDKFKLEAMSIINEVRFDKFYRKLYEYNGIIHNVKTDSSVIYEVCTSEMYENKFKNKQIRLPNDSDEKAIEFSKTIKLKKLGLNFIDESFLDSDSFSANFITSVGGNNFKYLWTKRNLYVLSLIFSKILKQKDENIKKQLVFGFLMTTHLCCKMNVPRRNEAQRNFSTSWGRSAYVCAKRQMEQNPLIIFFNSCFGKQSVESALKNSNKYIDKNLKIKEASISNKRKNDNAFDLKIGIVNSLNLESFLQEKSVDFVLTDPPYGGLVQYFDLSYLWIVWLKNYDKKFSNLDFDSEITINKNHSLESYETKFTQSLKQIYKVLKDSGRMVITFHNKNIKIWNSFIRSLQNADFIIEKVIHQKNRRSGESVVANPYGTSGTDFYIRCKKSDFAKNLKTQDSNELEKLIIKYAIEAISIRNEPTPFYILFDTILAKIASSGYFFSDNCDCDIKQALDSELNKTFVIVEGDSKAGKLWWLKEPQKHICMYHIPLNERVERAILYELKSKHFIRLDDALAIIYKSFPNGLTPDETTIEHSLKKFAYKSSGGFIYNDKSPNAIEATLHTQYIHKLYTIGKKLKFDIFIGKREQSENIAIKNKKYRLKEFCDILDLTNIINIKNNEYTQSRAQMIDVLWIKNRKIEYIFEVENSTNIISTLHRASVLDDEINKIIVIPNSRENELLNLKEPLTQQELTKWTYLLYSDLDKLSKAKNPNLNYFLKKAQNE